MLEPSVFSINENKSLDQLSDNSSFDETIETAEEDANENEEEIV